MAIFFGWLVFSVVAGMVGSDRNIGFWGAFLLSIFFSPLIGLILAFASRRKEEQPRRESETERKARLYDEQRKESDGLDIEKFRK